MVDSGIEAMLEARSMVLVGASERPGSLGARMVAQARSSAANPRIYLVNPRYEQPYLPSVTDVPEQPDLVVLAVPDRVLPAELRKAADMKARSAVIFGSAVGIRGQIADIARSAGMALCGAACMGFVNVSYGLRAVGYAERDELPKGPVALITHSGSMFATLLRTRRGFGYTVAVSSGQELVTTAADYARFALSLPETKILTLVLEAIRGDLPGILTQAAEAGVPVVLLTAGGSAKGRELVQAHSGRLAADDGAWEALAAAYGVHRVRDMAELADTVELFAAGRRATTPRIATVHDSGLERAHTADVAADVGVEFAAIGAQTAARLAAVLEPGLAPGNPLDVWGTGKGTEALFTECLSALAADPAVGAVALAVDLVTEFAGEDGYPRAIRAVAASTDKPVVVLAGLPAAVDQDTAASLRADGIPVLEGTRTGLHALRHLVSWGEGSPRYAEEADEARRRRWVAAELDGAAAFGLLRDYGVAATRVVACATPGEALAAAGEIGYPVVLKADGIAHKSDAGGVVLGLTSPDALAEAYAELSGRLGPRVLICETAIPGTELIIGLVRDRALGPLVVLGAGGIYTELLAERAVLLPPVSHDAALAAIARLRVARILRGARGRPAADLAAIAGAVVALSRLAAELGDVIEALDINPLICGPSGAVAADCLVIRRA
jgi:acyl-CoA synthetase (NDP forming)